MGRREKKIEGAASNVIRSCIVGSTSAAVSTILFQPLDLIKTRMIEKPLLCEAPTLLSVTRETLSSYEGRILSLWRGIVPSICRTVPGVGIHFGTLSFLESCGLKRKESGSLNALLCGMFSRSAAATLTIPVTVVKVRYESRLYQYKSVSKALRDLYGKEGLRGMSSGLLPTILRDAPFSGIYLAFYTTLKKRIGQSPTPYSDMPVVHFLCGLIAGVCASAITQPADVIKTKMQLERYTTAENLLGISISVWNESGVKGFFVGLSPRLIRRSLMAALTWSFYEELMKRAK